MDLDELLALRGTDRPAAMNAVDQRFGLGDEQLVLAVGSLVEGLGNSKSDVDLLLIGPEDAASPAGPATVVVGRCLIDVCVLPTGEVSALLDRFEEWSTRPWDVTHSAGFTIDERTLLHRFHHGRRLHDGRRSAIAERFPLLPDLAGLKLHTARQNARTIQVDMVGNREAGDYQSLVFAAQELLGQAVDALVAGYGLTNPLVKWRSRLLDMLPEDWERNLAARPSGMSASSRVWQLHRAPREPAEISALRHAYDISSFARAVFAWGESALLGWSAGARGASWDEIESEDEAHPLPVLDFDVDFAPTADGAVLARLNEFDTPLELSSGDFALAMLFDGRTSEREASLAVYGSGADDDAVARLLAQVREANLCRSP